MELIIIGVIAFFVIRYLKNRSSNKPVKVVSIGDPSTLPDTLNELRKKRDRAKNDEIRYQCRRKICEVGIKLYEEGKIVNDSKSEYDVSLLLEEMYELINDCHTYAFLPVDEEFEFRCLDAGVKMSEDLNPDSPADGGVFKFLDYSWERLADLCAEGKACPRDPAKARKYYRMRITYEIKMKDTYTRALQGLMEVPNEGEDGKQEILKYTAAKYGIGAVLIKKGEIARNFQAQPVQQAAELLFEMDWGKIGSPDISVMMEEYKKGADNGNAYAQYKLGQFYLKGRYVEKNEAYGLELLEKAADQDLYLAVSEIANHYYWLANPYAGDYGKATKAQIKEWKALDAKWSKRDEILSTTVELAYADSFTDYIKNSAGISTRGPGKYGIAAEKAYNEDQTPVNEEDESSVFSVFDLPDVITGPYEVTYRKQNMDSDSAEYYSDHGDTAIIRVSDIRVGIAGFSAKNSYGYFYW